MKISQSVIVAESEFDWLELSRINFFRGEVVAFDGESVAVQRKGWFGRTLLTTHKRHFVFGSQSEIYSRLFPDKGTK